MTRDQVGATLRFMMVSPAGGSQVPAAVHAAYRGDFTPLGERALLQRRMMPAAFSRGLFYSVICAEEAARIDEAEVAESFACTPWGEAWVRGLVADCSHWPIGELPDGYFDPPESTAPVLILHGWLDPVAPPSWAHELGRHLPNATVIIVREGHHNFDLAECGNRMVADFIEQPGPVSVHPRCAAQWRRPAFQVPGASSGPAG
jgi:pimeloyl-ACP methyl ester carboxylesterase